MPLIGEYLTPIYFFVVAVGLAAGIVVRRSWRINSDSRSLDRAEHEGRLSNELRRRWDRDRIYFTLQILFILAFSVWIFWSLDELLQP